MLSGEREKSNYKTTLPGLRSSPQKINQWMEGRGLVRGGKARVTEKTKKRLENNVSDASLRSKMNQTAFKKKERPKL